jgi:hypothetical protein
MHSKPTTKQQNTTSLLLPALAVGDMSISTYLFYPIIGIHKINFDYWDNQHTIILSITVAVNILALLLYNKKCREFLKKNYNNILFLLTLFSLIAVGVAIGEAAAAGNFIEKYLQLYNYPHSFISVSTNITLVSAFILSMALFVDGMWETKEKAGPISNSIWYGEYKDKDGNVKRYTLLQRFLLLISVLAAAAAAFVCGALAYNSMLALGATKLQAMAIWGLDLFAYTCVFNVYFVLTLKHLFELYNDPNGGLWNAIKERNKQFGGIVPQILFWLLFGTLSVGVAIVSYALFYGQVRDFSLQLGSLSITHISPAWAHMITALAMIVDFTFRWKSIWKILNFAFNKSYRKEALEGETPKDLTTEPSDKTNNKTQKNVIIAGWCLLGIVPSLINGFGQGAGSFYAKDILPKWLSSSTMLYFYLASLVLGSAGANAFSVLDCLNRAKNWFFNKKENDDTIRNAEELSQQDPSYTFT